MRGYVKGMGLAMGLILAHSSAQGAVKLKLMQWSGYISFLAGDFEKYAKSQGMDATFEVVTPDIVDEEQLFQTIRSADVDICTPSSSFFRARQGKLMQVLAPVDHSKVSNYSKIPEKIRSASFNADEKGNRYGTVFTAGPYGLAYNTAKVTAPPDSWEVLWKPEAKGNFSVNGETAFVNAYIAAWAHGVNDPTVVYDLDKVDRGVVTTRLNNLAAGAKSFWTGHGLDPAVMKDLSYTATWGFDVVQANAAGQKWRIASPKEGTSIWVDSISLTAKAAKDPEKVKAYYLLANFLISKEAQLTLMKTIGSFPLNLEVKSELTPEQIADYHVGDEKFFDERFFWAPMSDRTANAYTKLWEEAMKKAGKK